jgi:serine phosphatase RsbU (regulator of sigma subunit)
VLSRNNPNPIHVLTQKGVSELAEPSKPVGLYRHTKPVISELPLAPHTVVVVYTDGLPGAGVRRGETLDVRAEIERLHRNGVETAQTWADDLLAVAVQRDEGRPNDDISILVMAVLPRQSDDPARRMMLRVPL